MALSAAKSAFNAIIGLIRLICLVVAKIGAVIISIGRLIFWIIGAVVKLSHTLLRSFLTASAVTWLVIMAGVIASGSFFSIPKSLVMAAFVGLLYMALRALKLLSQMWDTDKGKEIPSSEPAGSQIAEGPAPSLAGSFGRGRRKPGIRP